MSRRITRGVTFKREIIAPTQIAYSVALAFGRRLRWLGIEQRFDDRGRMLDQRAVVLA